MSQISSNITCILVAAAYVHLYTVLIAGCSQRRVMHCFMGYTEARRQLYFPRGWSSSHSG